MLKRITKIANKESLTTKLTLIIIGLTAGSALLIPATYASFHPVTSSEIADDTILSRDIRNGQVGSVDIGQGQVTSGDIQDNGITSADLGNVVTIVKGSLVSITGGSINFSLADCPPGKILTGGGFTALSARIHVLHSYPEDSNTWEAQGFLDAPSDTSGGLQAYALCV